MRDQLRTHERRVVGNYSSGRALVNRPAAGVSVASAPERADEGLHSRESIALLGLQLANLSTIFPDLLLICDDHLHPCQDELSDSRDLAVMRSTRWFNVAIFPILARRTSWRVR